jgi:hypothetical protein
VAPLYCFLHFLQRDHALTWPLQGAAQNGDSRQILNRPQLHAPAGKQRDAELPARPDAEMLKYALSQGHLTFGGDGQFDCHGHLVLDVEA